MHENEQKYIELQKRIDAYLNGDLSQKEIDELWADIIGNPDYYKYFETNIHLRQLYSKSKTSPSPSTTSDRQSSKIHILSPRWYWYVAAAAILIIVLSVNLLKMNHQDSLDALSVKEISNSEIESPDIMRSDSGKTKKSDSLLNLGYHATITGDIKKAEDIYATIIDRYNNQSSTIQAHLNLGILKYNQKEYQLATDHFKTVIKQLDNGSERRLLEKAYWYLGNTYLNLKESDKAQRAIYNSWAINGIYRKPAERLLKEMDYEFSKAEQE